jgi:hypothetical protein
MSGSLRNRVVRLAGALGCLAALWACNAPFIPVPPPATVFTPALVADGAGGQKTVWVTEGAPDPRAALAKFFLFNNDRGTGVIVDAAGDGAYQAPPLDGVRGDRVFVYYENPAGDDSEVACRQLIEGPDPAPACTQ